MYMADKRIGITEVQNHVLQNGFRFGTCKLFLIVTGVPNHPPQGDVAPVGQVRFKLFYAVEYHFNSNHQVTFIKATPATPAIRCIN